MNKSNIRAINKILFNTNQKTRNVVFGKCWRIGETDSYDDTRVIFNRLLFLIMPGLVWATNYIYICVTVSFLQKCHADVQRSSKIKFLYTTLSWKFLPYTSRNNVYQTVSNRKSIYASSFVPVCHGGIHRPSLFF